MDTASMSLGSRRQSWYKRPPIVGPGISEPPCWTWARPRPPLAPTGSLAELKYQEETEIGYFFVFRKVWVAKLHREQYLLMTQWHSVTLTQSHIWQLPIPSISFSHIQHTSTIPIIPPHSHQNWRGEASRHCFQWMEGNCWVYIPVREGFD